MQFYQWTDDSNYAYMTDDDVRKKCILVASSYIDDAISLTKKVECLKVKGYSVWSDNVYYHHDCWESHWPSERCPSYFLIKFLWVTEHTNLNARLVKRWSMILASTLSVRSSSSGNFLHSN